MYFLILVGTINFFTTFIFSIISSSILKITILPFALLKGQTQKMQTFFLTITTILSILISKTSPQVLEFYNIKKPHNENYLLNLPGILTNNYEYQVYGDEDYDNYLDISASDAFSNLLGNYDYEIIEEEVIDPANKKSEQEKYQQEEKVGNQPFKNVHTRSLPESSSRTTSEKNIQKKHGQHNLPLPPGRPYLAYQGRPLNELLKPAGHNRNLKKPATTLFDPKSWREYVIAENHMH